MFSLRPFIATTVPTDVLAMIANDGARAMALLEPTIHIAGVSWSPSRNAHTVIPPACFTVRSLSR